MTGIELREETIFTWGAPPLKFGAGASDEIVDPETQSARLAREVDGSELLLVAEAGHMVHHTASKQVAQAIAARRAGKQDG